MDNADLIGSALHYLTCSLAHKAEYVKALPTCGLYLCPDDDEVEAFDTSMTLVACRSILGRFITDYDLNSEASLLYSEIESVVEYMLLAADTSSDYHFQQLGSDYRASGPYDGGWDILQRLGKLLISESEFDMYKYVKLEAIELLAQSNYMLIKSVTDDEEEDMEAAPI